MKLDTRNDASGHETHLTAAAASNGGIDYVQLLLRFKWLIVAGVAAGMGLGQAAYWKLGPRFDAYTQLLVSKRESVLDDEENAKTRSGDRTEHIALIMSPMIVDRAIKSGGLEQLESLAGYDDPTEAILSNLQVKRSAGQDRSFLNVVDIRYTANTPSDARSIVAAIVAAYDEYLQESHRESTEELLRLIDEAGRNIRTELRDKESEYLEFRRTSPLVWRNAPGAQNGPEDVTNVHQERVLAIEKERHQLILKQTELQSRINSLADALQRNAPPELLDLMVQRVRMGQQADGAAPEVQQAQSEHDNLLLPLLMERSQLLRDFGPDYPQVREVEQRIAKVQEFYRQRGVRLPDVDDVEQTPDDTSRQRAADLLALLRHELQELQDRDRQLEQQFASESTAAKEYAVFQSRDLAFVEEIQHLKELRSTIEKRAKTSSLEKDNTGYEMKQIAPIRDELVFKRQLKFIASGLLAGLALMLSFAVYRDLRNTTLKSLEEIQRRLPLPILGAVPESTSRVARDPRLSRSLGFFHFPESALAESYRTIRTAMHTMARNQRVIAVTSSEPGDGKSTLIGNLAIAMAHAGQRVLLVDGDLRCPSLAELFGANHDIGLTDVLEGEIEWENALHETPVNGLTLLSSGQVPSNPSELLSRPALEHLLTELRHRYDVVLVDTPPILAVSDTCSIGQHVDGLLLVVRLNKTPRASAVRALELIEAHQIGITGMIANGYELPAGLTEVYGYVPPLESAGSSRRRPPRSHSSRERVEQTV